MDNQVRYTKLSALVDSQFTVQKSLGYKFKKWDPQAGRMIVSEKPEVDFRKTYTLDTDKGRLDVGPGQIGNMLESVMVQGKADIIGRTYSVKSNGKTGMEIRYYLNPVKTEELSLLDQGEELPPEEELPF